MINVSKDNLIAGHKNYHSFFEKATVAKKKNAPAKIENSNITTSSACQKHSGFFSPKNQVSFGNTSAATKQSFSFIRKIFPKLEEKFDKLLTSDKFKDFAVFTAGNSGIMEAISAVGIVCTLRPAIIALTPGSEKRDKQYAITRSWATAAIELGTAYLLLKPIGNAYKAYEESIHKAFELIEKEELGKLKKPIEQLASKFEIKIINSVKNGGLRHLKDALAQKANSFTITFGPKILTTPPRALLTVAFIPAIMKRIFPKKPVEKSNEEKIISPIRFQSNRATINKICKKIQMKENKIENK